MSDSQSASQDSSTLRGVPPPAPAVKTAWSNATARLPNLVKLYHVPVFALRDLIKAKSPARELDSLRHAELVKEADETPGITAADVDELYENYRYGQRLTFCLYVLPSGLSDPGLAELQTTLHELVEEERADVEEGWCACQDYECEACPHQITLLDEEELDGFHEMRFRYYVIHRFLNAGEHPDEVLQSRYGFLWLDLKVGYLAILARDERVSTLLMEALGHCLRAVPMPVCFPKELLDKHFSIERAKHLSYLDPGTGVRRSISGQGLWQRFEREIMAREQQDARPSSLYEEELAQGMVSGVGITATKGKIFLTRTLPTSVVRAWARERLPDLMRDVKEMKAYQADSLGYSTEAVSRMHLPTAARAAINMIVEGLLQTEKEELTSVSLPQNALEIYQALAGRYFIPYLRTQCNECEQSAELCPKCEGRNLNLKSATIICLGCGAVLTGKDGVALRCMNGHITRVPLAQAWNIAPNHWLQKRIASVYAEVGRSWDEKSDYFHIEGNTLYRLRRGRVESCNLPPVVQNYVSNFWDPVKGQVHAGSGDIIAAPGAGENTGRDGSEPGLASRPGAVPPAAREKEGEGMIGRREEIKPTVTYTPTFYGPIYGPTHTGSGSIHIGSVRYGLDAAELAGLFAALRKQVEELAPADKKDEAMQQVDQLKAAVQEPKPSINKIEAVVNWFKKNLPSLAGAVVSVVVNPIVGRMVSTAGELAAEEIRKHFA